MEVGGNAPFWLPWPASPAGPASPPSLAPPSTGGAPLSNPEPPPSKSPVLSVGAPSSPVHAPRARSALYTAVRRMQFDRNRLDAEANRRPSTAGAAIASPVAHPLATAAANRN